MRSRDERRAEFERREVERKARYAAAKARNAERGARWDANIQERKAAAVAARPVPEPRPELTEEQKVALAVLRLAQPMRVYDEFPGSVLLLPWKLAEMRKDARAIREMRAADKPPADSST